jgi:hypothetical protein
MEPRMPLVEPDPAVMAAQVLEAVAAGLWPSLSPAERRELALLALGLRPLAAWADGRMVYVEAAD